MGLGLKSMEMVTIMSDNMWMASRGESANIIGAIPVIIRAVLSKEFEMGMANGNKTKIKSAIIMKVNIEWTKNKDMAFSIGLRDGFTKGIFKMI